MEWHPATVACNYIAGFRGEPRHLYLDALEGRIHGAGGSAGSSLFCEYIPRLKRMTQFQFDSLYSDRPDLRKAKLHVRSKPLLLEIIVSPPQLHEHIGKVAPDKMRQHKTVMERGAPTDQACFEWTFPKHAYQRADEQHLYQTHSDMRSHFEGTQFDQAQAQPATLRGIELVDAKLGAMRVSSDIDQQVAEQSIHHDRRAVVRRQIAKSNLQFVQGIRARLVYARRLACRAHIHAGKQIRERWMVLPECQHEIGRAHV